VKISLDALRRSFGDWLHDAQQNSIGERVHEVRHDRYQPNRESDNGQQRHKQNSSRNAVIYFHLASSALPA
jgi:hypothetical protein